MPGNTHSDMVGMPIERVRDKCRFVLEATEKYWIEKYDCVKTLPVRTIKSGLNLRVYTLFANCNHKRFVVGTQLCQLSW